MNLIDAIGQTHKPATNTPRIVSLVPSLTELLCDLGLAPLVVGRTGFCIHPHATVQAIPKVGGTKDVNIEKIRRLQPSHILLNIDENEKPAFELLAQFVPNVIVTHPLAPQDNVPLYRLLGGIFGATGAAEALCQDFEAALARLQAATVSASAQRVLYLIWKDPWMSIGPDTYIARMLSLINWQQLVFTAASGAVASGAAASGAAAPGAPVARYPAFEWEAVPLQQVDRILLSSEPYRFQRAHVDELARQLGRPVQLVDGEMLSWYGSRAIAGLNYLQALAAKTTRIGDSTANDA